MQNKLIKIANETNLFLKHFIKNQKKTELISAMSYGLFPLLKLSLSIHGKSS